MTTTIEQVKQVAEALSARLAQAPPGTPCAVQAGKTLAYAGRELAGGSAERRVLRILESAAAWVQAAEGG